MPAGGSIDFSTDYKQVTSLVLLTSIFIDWNGRNKRAGWA